MSSEAAGARPERINVVGTSGSGKSHFSRRLAAALNVPHIEMDRVFWRPNWTQPSDEEFFRDLRVALAPPRWVLDGNYTRSIPIKWEKIDLVVWLDYPFALTLFQAVKRAVARAWKKHELWPGTGNRESFRKSFLSRESILWWTITTHGPVRRKYESYLTDPRFSHIRFVRLRSRAEAERFLSSLSMN